MSDFYEMREAVRNIHRLPVDQEILTRGQCSQEDQAIHEAVQRYSLRRPLAASVILTLDSGRAPLSFIVGWGDDYQANDVYSDGYRLPPEACAVVPGEGGPVLHIPAARGATVQFFFAKPHSLTENSSTIPAIDFMAVAHLAASLVLMQMANLYAQKKQASIDAAAVDFGRLSGEYFLRARDESNLYEEHMKSRNQYKSARVNWNSRARHGLGRMFQDGPYQ